MTLRAISNIGYSGGGIGLKSAGVLAQSAVPASVTGTTTETTLATINIPAGAVGPNGSLSITTLWTMTNNADTKTTRIRLAGQGYLAFAAASVMAQQSVTIIRNRNAYNSQIGYNSASSTGLGSTGSSNTASTVDMSQAQSLTITGQLGTSTDTITLEGYTVELLNP